MGVAADISDGLYLALALCVARSLGLTPALAFLGFCVVAVFTQRASVRTACLAIPILWCVAVPLGWAALFVGSVALFE